MGAPRSVTANGKAAAEIGRLVAQHGKPVVIQSMYPASPSLTSVVAPVFGAIEDAAASLAVGDVVDRAARIRSAPPAGCGRDELGYFGSRRLLADAGVRFPPAVEVSTVRRTPCRRREPSPTRTC